MSIPCISCNDSVVKDLSGVAQLRSLNRMIADNYTVIIISFITIILLIIIAKYFGKIFITTIITYRSNVNKFQEGIKQTSTINDDENYDEDEQIDSSKYFDAGKLDFVQKMQNAYKDYNTKKSQYIQNTYSEQNDDVINKDTLYQKYDNYNYNDKNIEK